MSTLPLTNGTDVARSGSTDGWGGTLAGPPDYVSTPYSPGDKSTYARFQIQPSSPLGSLPAFFTLNITPRYSPVLTGTQIADDTIAIGDASGPTLTNYASNAPVNGAVSIQVATAGIVLADFNAGLYYLWLGFTAIPATYSTGAYAFTYSGSGTTDNNGTTSPWGPTPPYNLDTGNGTSIPGYAQQSGILTVNVTGPDGPMWASVTPNLLGRGDVIVVFPRVDECAASVSETFGEGYTNSASTTGLEPQSATLSSAHTIKINVAAGTGSTPVAVFARGEGITGASTGRYNANVNIAATAVNPDNSTLTISALSLSYDTTGGVDSFLGAVKPQDNDDMAIVYLGESLPIPAQLTQYSTGAAYDATGTVSARVYKGGDNTPVLTGSLTVKDNANTTGLYEWFLDVTSENGFEVDTFYYAQIQTTVDSIAQAGVTMQFVVRENPATATASAVWDTLDFGDAPGRATTVGGQLAQIWRFLFNKNKVDKLAATQTVYRDDSLTPMLSGPIVVNDSYSDRAKLS